MKVTLWSLYHNEHQTQVNELTESLLCKELRKYEKSDLSHLYVWCSNFSDWRLLKDVSDLSACVDEGLLKHENTRGQTEPHPIPSAPPPPPPHSEDNNSLGTYSKPNKHFHGLKLKPAPEPDSSVSDFFIRVDNNNKDLGFNNRRQFERYSIKLRVIIRSKNLSFRTFTENISLGGVALIHAIPEQLLGSDCHILIAGDKDQGNIRFQIKLIHPEMASRFKFGKDDQQNMQKLQLWIEQFIKKQKKAKHQRKVG